jgi:hypothetical protein
LEDGSEGYLDPRKERSSAVLPGRRRVSVPGAS